MTPTSSPSERRVGFSLAELIVVLIIMAIAAALAIPLVVSTTSQQAQAAARMVMADLEYAQNYAVTTQCEVTVEFDVDQDAYVLTYLDPVSNARVTLKHPITHKDYQVDFATARGFERTGIAAASFGGSAAVTFDALGAPRADGGVTVAAGAYTYRVTVAPVTGRVSVAEVP